MDKLHHLLRAVIKKMLYCLTRYSHVYKNIRKKCVSFNYCKQVSINDIQLISIYYYIVYQLLYILYLLSFKKIAYAD